MKKIGIIGGGFTGTMTAVQLIEKLDEECQIIIINERETFNKGIAFNPYSDRHLLNVVAGKMGAFPDKETDFLEWVMQRPEFRTKDRTIVANSFLPRRLYGKYLMDIWNDALTAALSKRIQIRVVDSFVVELELNANLISLNLANDESIQIDQCVIATGNHLPRNPKIENDKFFNSKKYFQNPWQIEAVQGAPHDLPILIVGNGLTMVDTVLGLLEQGFKGEIYSLSPHGFNILPHRHNGVKYSRLEEELTDDIRLLELVKLVNRHIKSVKEFGVSAEPIIDSLRPHTQNIWKNLTADERRTFMSRLRHLWGVARHRIPLHIHDRIQELRINGRLHVVAGKLVDCQDETEYISTKFYDKKSRTFRDLKVSRIINCTGPESDLGSLRNSFLKNCLMNGIIQQDELKLGIVADIETYQVIDSSNKRIKNLFTIGSNLRGELWESTAVSELRVQAEKLANKIAQTYSEAGIESQYVQATSKR